MRRKLDLASEHLTVNNKLRAVADKIILFIFNTYTSVDKDIILRFGMNFSGQTTGESDLVDGNPGDPGPNLPARFRIKRSMNKLEPYLRSFLGDFQCISLKSWRKSVLSYNGPPAPSAYANLTQKPRFL